MARELEMPSSLNEWIEGATVVFSLAFVFISARWVWSAYTSITYQAIPSSADLLAFRDLITHEPPRP